MRYYSIAPFPALGSPSACARNYCANELESLLENSQLRARGGRGDVTLECRGVTLAGLGIRNVTCAYV